MSQVAPIVRKLVLLAALVPMLLLANRAADLPSPEDSAPVSAPVGTPEFPKFRMQEIATDLEVGYAVLLVDIDGDGKKDIVVADAKRVVWYQNPTWKMHTIPKPGQTASDNVCIDAWDI